MAGWPRYPNDSFEKSPHLPSDLQATVPRILKGTARENKELSKLLFTPLQLEAPAFTLGMVPWRANPSGRTVWWGTLKVWLRTASQNRTQTEADFGKHPTPHQHHWRRLQDAWGAPTSHGGTYFPRPTGHRGGRQHAIASTTKSTIWWWLSLSEMFVRITVPLIYCQGPEGPGPHVSSPGAISLCPNIATAGPVSSSPQPCPAQPWVPPSWAHWWAHGPSWPRHMPIPREVPDAHGSGSPWMH